MTEIGYALSSEEHTPLALVDNARSAEEAGFSFALISDHFHPWTDRQGNSPFVWSVLGGIAGATSKLVVGTGVTCPMIRTHPAIIAQAAATTAAMMPGRFFLGVGTGEALNEHITGDKWPEYDIRAEMLEEAVEIIRALWKGETMSHYGPFYTVENARLYTLPERLPEIYFAAGGPKATEVAGRVGDGLIANSADKELIAGFEDAGGSGKPKYGQLTVCWAATEKKARKTAHEWWPTSAIRGEASQELPMPAHFEQLAETVTEDQVAEAIVCGPDARRYLDEIREYVDAGFTHVYLHQVGPDQAGFFEFCQREILPEFAAVAAR